MTTLDFVATDSFIGTDRSTRVDPLTAIRFGVVTIQLHDDLWRVTRPDGDVLGYIERSSSAAGSRFVAKRMLQRQRRFLPIGEFWSISDALDCFRF
ncbi:MAG: hypothetical protein ABJA94_08205 [Rhodoglobus sp.]